jgi:hypothetical protein
MEVVCRRPVCSYLTPGAILRRTSAVTYLKIGSNIRIHTVILYSANLLESRPSHSYLL